MIPMDMIGDEVIKHFSAICLNLARSLDIGGNIIKYTLSIGISSR